MRNSPRSRIPLRLIAEKAGVSRMTVSLALRASPAISKETGCRIQEIALQLGYRPDPVVADLMANLRLATKSQNAVSIGVITCDRDCLTPREHTLQSAYFNGAREKAASLGYQLEEFRLHQDGMTERRIDQIMIARGMEGLILFPRPVALSPMASRLDVSHFACVAIGPEGKSLGIHQVDFDHCHAAMEACAQVRQIGYRLPGLLLNAEQDQRSAHRLRAGFLTDQHLHSEGKTPRILIRPHLDYSEFAHWMHHQRPDVILHAMEGATLVRWLQRLGLRVPNDVGLVCLERDPNESGVAPQAKAVGAAAVELVTAALAKHERGKPALPMTVTVAGSWISGTTTQPVARTAYYAASAPGSSAASNIEVVTPLVFDHVTPPLTDRRRLRAS